MSCTIEPSADGKYIIQKVTGEITRQSAMQYNIDTHALGKKLGIKKYLVDVTEARNVDTITDNYQFAYKDMKETPGIDRSARIATLVSPGDHSHDFIETVARNSGLDVTLFTDRLNAINHLLKDA